MTQVFSAYARREVVESELEAFLKRESLSGFVAQCPQPSPNKVAVVNAQTTAIEFNRKLGAVMHECVSARSLTHQSASNTDPSLAL